MSQTIYDDLRELLEDMACSTSRTEADEILVSLIDELAMYLSPHFPSINDRVDSIIAEWRKKRD